MDDPVQRSLPVRATVVAGMDQGDRPHLDHNSAAAVVRSRTDRAHRPPAASSTDQDRVPVLTYSINVGWRAVCPGCAGVTLGENVVDTPPVGAIVARIYAVCDACGWEGLGV